MTTFRRLSSVTRTLAPAFLLVCACLTAWSQTSHPSDVLILNNWCMHSGDNPAYASPSFDDSAWTAGGSPVREIGLVVSSGYRWYRTTVQLPHSLVGRELALGIGPLTEVYEIYINGVSVGRFGEWLPAPHSPFDRNLTFPIPLVLTSQAVLHVAVRTWNGDTSTSLFPFFMSGAARFTRPIELGPLSTIDARTRLHVDTGIVQNLPWNLSFIAMVVAGCIALVLFSAQRDHREYLYLALYCIGFGVDPLIGGLTAASDTILRRSLFPLLVNFLYMLVVVFSFLFLAQISSRFRSIIRFGALVYLGFGFSIVYAEYAQATYTTLAYWGAMAEVPLFFYSIAIVGIFLDRKLGSVAIAVSLLVSQASGFWVNVGASLFHANDLRFMPLGPFLVDIRAVSQLLFVSTTLIVLFLRFRQDQIHQVALERDMASARRMQQQLLGSSSASAPGFIVDAVYLPAHEVGGDFYRTVSLPDGSMLVAVGDVSGKGLDAAMLVAAILGSLANETERMPASLLGYLNRAVVGRTGGGFITACCARIFPNGSTLVANAGHIAPWLNNRELELENGLPLGISAEATYAEREFIVSGTLTFISDGVVEARDSAGELLGFDRMPALTSSSASQIAATAQSWGQQDDITVLRIARAT